MEKHCPGQLVTLSVHGVCLLGKGAFSVHGSFICYSFIHSLMRTFIHSFVHSFVHSLIHSFTHLPIDSSIHSSIPAHSIAHPALIQHLGQSPRASEACGEAVSRRARVKRPASSVRGEGGKAAAAGAKVGTCLSAAPGAALTRGQAWCGRRLWNV